MCFRRVKHHHRLCLLAGDRGGGEETGGGWNRCRTVGCFVGLPLETTAVGVTAARYQRQLHVHSNKLCSLLGWWAGGEQVSGKVRKSLARSKANMYSVAMIPQKLVRIFCQWLPPTNDEPTDITAGIYIFFSRHAFPERSKTRPQQAHQALATK